MGHTLIFSGVEENRRAAAGVGCIIHKKLENQIISWKPYSERVLSVEMRNKNDTSRKTIVVVYGPNEDETAKSKDRFWEELTTAIDEAKGKLYT